MREDILRKLHRLRYCVLWPGNWDDIGFTERPIWVNENGYGYYSDDVPCCFMHIEGFTPLFLNQTIEKLNAGILTPDDLTGTPLDHSPFVSVGYIEEESLRGFLHDLSISPFIIKESFFCGEDLDRWRFFDSEESLIDAFKMDYCDGGLWDEMSDDELTIWDSRLFEPGQYFELPIHLSILTNSNSIIPEYVANQRTIIRAITPTGQISIKYTDIRPYWPEARPSLLEGGRSFVAGSYLIFTMITASGQAGVICVWDCESNRLVHISEGAYCIAAAIDNGTLYLLRDISNYCMPYHLRVYSCPFGTMNSDAEGTALYAEKPVKIDNYVKTVPTAELNVINGRITIKIGGEEILFSSNEKNAHTMKEEFSSYYTPSQNSMDAALSIRQGMLL